MSRFGGTPRKPTGGPVGPAGGGSGGPGAGGGGTGGSGGANARFVRRPVQKERAHPRPVPGGVKPEGDPGARGWAAQRWMRAVETNAEPVQLAEGREYAVKGQTRSLELESGCVNARVQGRQVRAYRVEIRLPRFSASEWDAVMGPLLAQASYAATLLAGELPANIEDVFAPANLRLFPTETADFSVSCSCDIGGPWCKHAVCAMVLVADKLDREPFLIFDLRGLPEEDLLAQLRQQRALGSAVNSGRALPVYQPHLPDIPERQPSLDELVDGFWRVGDSLAELDLPIAEPEVSHPMLRRLGTSPFEEAKFPLLGLLATCTELIGESAIRDASSSVDEGEDVDEEDVD